MNRVDDGKLCLVEAPYSCVESMYVYICMYLCMYGPHI